MKWEPLPQEEIILRESDDKFIVSNLRVSIKESYSFKSIPLQDINSMKILRKKSKGILIAGIIWACLTCYLLFFGNPSNRQSTAIGFVFSLLAILRYYSFSKRTLEFNLTEGSYIYKADNILYGELISFVRAIEKAIGKENSTEVVD